MDKILKPPVWRLKNMASGEELKDNDKKSKAAIKEAGGVHGWLLKKAKTFMWDAASNTLILPKGVVLTKEEKEALEEVIGAIRDEAKEFEKHRQLQMMAAQESGVKFKTNVVRGYNLLVSGSYRELTGVLAHRVHGNLQGMLMVNKRFLEGVWKVIGSLIKDAPQKPKSKPLVMPRGRDGR